MQACIVVKPLPFGSQYILWENGFLPVDKVIDEITLKLYIPVYCRHIGFLIFFCIILPLCNSRCIVVVAVL